MIITHKVNNSLNKPQKYVGYTNKRKAKETADFGTILMLEREKANANKQ